MLAHAQASGQTIGLLDVGTAKMACLMLAVDAAGGARVIGFGHQRSRGLKASVIVDAEAAEDALRATVSQAEQMAGVVLEDVVVAVACGRLGSTHLTTGRELAGGMVTAADLAALVEAARGHADSQDRTALHVEVLGLRVDGQPVAEPGIGQPGRHLALDVTLVSADQTPLRHLTHVMTQCRLRVRGMTSAALASALAVTAAEDCARGVIAIDCGAGTTSIALIAGGKLLAAHVLQIGANHLTYDLMRALDTSINEAERIKKNYARMDPAQRVPGTPSNLVDTIAYRPRDENHATDKQVTRAAIQTTLTSRVDALLQQIGQRIERCGLPPQLFGCVTLTGGGSQLPLLAERAAAVLGRPVRVAAPKAHPDWPQQLLQPAFATVLGLRDAALGAALSLRREPALAMAATGPLRRVRG
jgi:cell division protein FtsA